MSQHNHTHAQQQRRPIISVTGRRDEDEYAQSYIAMLNVMRRLHDLYGDPSIGEIIEKAERALGRR